MMIQPEQLVDLTLASLESDITFLQRLELSPDQLDKLYLLKEQIESLILSQAMVTLETDLDVDKIFNLILWFSVGSGGCPRAFFLT